MEASFYSILKTTAEHWDPAVLDLSVSVNPLGPPQGVPQAVAAVTPLCAGYPDGSCAALTQAACRVYGLSPDQLFWGAGAGELIDRLVRAVRPKRALLPVPTFEDYEKALRRQGCQVSYFYLEEQDGFQFSSRFLEALTPDLDLVFLCQPNNPTGQVIPAALLREILARCRENSIFTVVDECFLGFLDQADALTARQFLNEFPHLAVIDAFTKLYALAGFRLGFCAAGDSLLLKKIEEAGPEFCVSIPAMAAGLAALADREYLPRTLAFLRKEKAFLRAALEKQGICPVGSLANFLFFPSPVPNLREKLQKKGVLIRNCESFRGLSREYCRAAVRIREDNLKFVGALAEVLREQSPYGAR